tara:strand:- start:16 stop:432 length:417 start_codon:yes stop_codon:yes gene_type:complete
MKIGELAKSAGVTAQAIRYYEREGILPKARRRYDSGYREYDVDARARLLFIKHAQGCGLKLADIKILLEWESLPDEACPNVQNLLSDRIDELDAKIREIRKFSESLKRLLAACEASSDSTCAAIEEFRNLSSSPPNTA